jgi:DNA-binding XRE family transcriptional regulator
VKVLYQRLLHVNVHPSRLRREIGMTQLELAETLGLHRTTIQQWEKLGEIRFKPALLVMLVMAGRHPLYTRCLGDDGKPIPPTGADKDWPFAKTL